MRLEQPHQLTLDEAKQRINQLADPLIEGPHPAGVEIRDAEKVWSGDVLAFCFDARKGFFRTMIHGAVNVGGDIVVFDCDIPAFVIMFVGEQRILDAAPLGATVLHEIVEAVV